MTADWSLAVVALSDSFRASLTGLVRELRGEWTAWQPATSPERASPCAATLVLAGGAEQEAIDLLGERDLGGAPRYVVGALADHRIAAGLIRAGATDYFVLPDDIEPLRRALERAARESRARSDADRLAAEERAAQGFDAIIGSSPQIRAAIDVARRVARHRDVTVLLGGETGTGKEVLARAIHYHSARAAAPFVEINCAAIPEHLLESELFGHEKGAFTGAVAAKPGLFELASGGTLFLDELGSLPLALQAKLLRALETRSIRRVGGQEGRTIDVRLLAATHVDLHSAVARGEFREDLYYRLHVVTITLPPLRERGSDVELLAEHFARKLAAQYSLAAPLLTSQVREALRQHRWPGNVRELRNAIERALVLSEPGTLDPGEFGPALLAPSRAPAIAPPEDDGLPFPADISTIIRAAADRMLRLTEGNKSEAARRLGISRPRLQRILDGQHE